MVLKILVIGDIGNIIHTISKYTKAKIHIINFFKDGAGRLKFKTGKGKRKKYLGVLIK